MEKKGILMNELIINISYCTRWHGLWKGCSGDAPAKMEKGKNKKGRNSGFITGSWHVEKEGFDSWYIFA